MFLQTHVLAIQDTLASIVSLSIVSLIIHLNLHWFALDLEHAAHQTTVHALLDAVETTVNLSIAIPSIHHNQQWFAREMVTATLQIYVHVNPGILHLIALLLFATEKMEHWLVHPLAFAHLQIIALVTLGMVQVTVPSLHVLEN